MLTDRQREVIEMRYAGRLSWAEIGRFLGCHYTTVQYHHDRALSLLSHQCGKGEQP